MENKRPAYLEDDFFVEPDPEITKVINEPEDTSAMAQTIKAAYFEYHGHHVSARRLVDVETGKFFLWQGRFDDEELIWVVGKTLETFEKKFREIADSYDAKE